MQRGSVKILSRYSVRLDRQHRLRVIAVSFTPSMVIVARLIVCAVSFTPSVVIVADLVDFSVSFPPGVCDKISYRGRSLE